MNKQTTSDDLINEGFNSQQDAQQRAHEWLVFLASEEANDSDRQRFNEWLAQDETHRTAYQHANAIWQAAASLESLKSLEPRFSDKPRASLWSTISQWLSFDIPQAQWAMALSLVAIIGLTLVIPSSPQTPPPQYYQTLTAEIRSVELADGSEITLSPQTQLEVSYSDKQRHVKLLQGEAFFIVAKNPQRPFIVDSRSTQVTVLGTRFNVNSNSFNTTVAVAEGKVQVESLAIPGYSDAETKLTAGQQISVSEVKGLEQVTAIDADNVDAWRRNVRIYEAQALEDVLRDLSRYHSAELVITDQSLNQQAVTAVFPTRNISQMLAALESVLPVTVVEIDDRRIEIRPR